VAPRSFEPSNSSFGVLTVNDFLPWRFRCVLLVSCSGQQQLLLQFHSLRIAVFMDRVSVFIGLADFQRDGILTHHASSRCGGCKRLQSCLPVRNDKGVQFMAAKPANQRRKASSAQKGNTHKA
jgi:hypothetical protein